MSDRQVHSYKHAVMDYWGIAISRLDEWTKDSPETDGEMNDNE